MQRRHAGDQAKRRGRDGQVRKPPRTNSIWPSPAWSAGRIDARGILADTPHLDTTGCRHRIACYEQPRAHEIAAPEPPRSAGQRAVIKRAPCRRVRLAAPGDNPAAMGRRLGSSRPHMPRGVRAAQAQARSLRRAGIIEANEQVVFPPLPCDRYPAAGHPLPDLPPYRGVPARQPQRGPDQALPPGPSGSARPSFPVASAGSPITSQVPSPASIAPGGPCGAERVSVPAVTECGHLS